MKVNIVVLLAILIVSSLTLFAGCATRGTATASVGPSACAGTIARAPGPQQPVAAMTCAMIGTTVVAVANAVERNEIAPGVAGAIARDLAMDMLIVVGGRVSGTNLEHMRTDPRTALGAYISDDPSQFNEKTRAAWSTLAMKAWGLQQMRDSNLPTLATQFAVDWMRVRGYNATVVTTRG